MITQLNQNKVFTAYFVDVFGNPLEDLTVTVNVYTPDNTLYAEDETATALGQGRYQYMVTAPEPDFVGDWTAVFSTTEATADLKSVAAACQVIDSGSPIVTLPLTELVQAVKDLALQSATIHLGNLQLEIHGKTIDLQQ